jgi:subtilisin family serine protease
MRQRPRSSRTGSGTTIVRAERLEARHLLAAFVPDDPLFFPGTDAGAAAGYYGQWHLENRLPSSPGLNAGIDAGLAGAWSQGLTGAGVTIGILDDGTQGDHPDLRDAFRNETSWDFGATAARNRASATRGAPVIDTLGPDGDNHGTAVAGVAAARGGNGIGTTGAAPQAGIAALRVLGRIAGGRSSDEAEAAAIRYQGQTNAAGQPDPFAPVDWSAGVPVRVKNHSYGPEHPFMPSARGTILPALAESAGHGVIHVVSAGNERGTYPTADANKSELNADPNVITVAALGSDGRFADYSSYGANVFVTAPSSSTGMFAISTTDRAGFDRGYNLDPDGTDPFLADVADGDATSTFGGTSSSAPLVSGIMALGVEANPALDVRMAKHLLVRTSRVVDAGNPSWTTNAAGFSFSDDYGFGLVDATRFTQAATEVSSLSPVSTFASPVIRVGERFTREARELTATYTVPDDAATAPLEAVRVTLNVGNLQTNLRAYRNGSGSGRGAISGDLEAYVTSPSGTRHRLFSNDRFLVGTESQRDRYGVPGARPRATLAWTFTSNAYWGESAAGDWDIELVNTAARSQLVGRTGTWRNVSFQFDTGSIEFGTAATAASVEWSRQVGERETGSKDPVGVSIWLASYGLTADVHTTDGTGSRPRRGRG